MNSSVKSAEQPEAIPPQPLAGGDVVTLPASRVQDPYAALDELMVVIEALCPTWPERALFPEKGDFRL